MGKTRAKWNEGIYRKRLKEGRGQGELSSYKPWLTIHDIASKGYAVRVYGQKTQRIHHLLSHYELYYFYLLEWSDQVLDIREQFPMRLSETVQIAAGAGIKHPWDNRSGFPYVMTTDFLITTEKGLMARTVKSTEELADRRVREKFEIERRYWAGCGIEWKIITEKQIDVVKAKNIIWLSSGDRVQSCIPDERQRMECGRAFLQMYEDPDIPFSRILEMADGNSGTGSGAGLSLFKELVRKGRIRLDLSRPVCFTDPRGQ